MTFLSIRRRFEKCYIARTCISSFFSLSPFRVCLALASARRAIPWPRKIPDPDTWRFARRDSTRANSISRAEGRTRCRSVHRVCHILTSSGTWPPGAAVRASHESDFKTVNLITVVAVGRCARAPLGKRDGISYRRSRQAPLRGMRSIDAMLGHRTEGAGEEEPRRGGGSGGTPGSEKDKREIRRASAWRRFR